MEFEVVHLPGLTDYQLAWELQREAHEQVSQGRRAPVIFLLEHNPVYTAGRRTHASEFPTARPGGGPAVEVVPVDRGGKITWHGPGQLVAYPIMPLAVPIDVVQFLRRLEEAVIAVCAEFGVEGRRVAGRSGVWACEAGGPLAKVCAVGARVARNVSMHGLALNCDPDLRAFGAIVPCGIDDAGVTSLSAIVGRQVTVPEVRPRLARALVAALTPQLAPDVAANVRGTA